MKRKLFLAIIAVLVVCLMCGVLFVACNDDPPADDGGNGGVTPPPVDPDNPDPGDEEDELTKSDVFIDLVNDFDAVEQDATGEKEFTFGLQIKDRADQTSVFGIALENVGGKDYLYGAVGTTVFTKFNGFDLGETFMTILNWLGPIDLSQVVGIQAGLDVESLTNPLVAGIVSDMLIGDFAVSESGDAYMVELSISKVLATIGTFVDLDAVINGALGEDTVTTVVNALAGVIGIELAEGSATVTGLLNAIANAYQVNFYFGFDTATADAADPFDALLPGVQAARDTQAKNLLNFTLDGTAEFKDEEGTVTNRYDIDVDIDLDIFPLLGLLDYVSTTGGVMTGDLQFAFNVDDPAEIVAMVEQMGYINVTVDEVNLEDGSFVKNILTIHSNFAEGNAIVQLNGASILIVDVGLGGVYDFDALAGYIADMIGGALSQADEGGEPAPEEPSLTDTILTVVKKLLVVPEGSIGDDLGSIDFEAILADISANGLTVKMSNIKSVLTDDLGLDLGLAGSVIGNVWENADTMNIKVESTSFGKAVRKETPSITAINSSSSSALVSEITSVEGLPTKVIDASGIVCGLDQVYAMKGKSIATGEEVEFDGYVIGYSGLDLSVSGVQNVTFYVAASNIGSGLVGMLAGTIDLSAYPVFGIYEYTAQVEVVQVGEDSEITTDGIVGGTYIPVAKNSTIWSNIAITDPAYLVIDGEVKTAITSDSVQVYTEDGTLIPTTDTTVFDANGNIIKEGRYEVRLVKGELSYSFDIQVIEITSSTKAEFVPAEGTDASILTDGIVLGQTYTWNGINIKIGDYVFDMEANYTSSLAFDIEAISDNIDGNSYTIAKNLNNTGNKTYGWKLKRSDSTVTKSFTTSIKVNAPEDIAVKKSSYYFGMDISSESVFAFTYKDVVYTLAYENNAWKLKDAEGNALTGATVALEWDKAGSGNVVTANADGLINTKNEYKSGSRSATAYVSVSVDGWSYSNPILIYELYASDKTSSYSALEIGEKLDGMISNANRITSGAKFAYGAEGYGIYDSEGTLICAVTVKVFDAEGADVTSTALGADGAFAAAGTYKVEYELTYKGLNQKFFHNVLVNAPEAEV